LLVTHYLLHYLVRLRESAFSKMADSLAISNFTMAAAIAGPGGWIISQILLVMYNWMDAGANTCGINFYYDNPEDDPKEKVVKKSKCFSNCCSSADKDENDKGEELADAQEASSSQGIAGDEEDAETGQATQTETDINQTILDWIFKAECKFQSETGR
jgi:hypothetical protein